MPYIEVRIAGPALTDETCRRLSSGISDIMSTILNKKRELVAISIEAIQPDRWFLTDTPVAETGLPSAFVAFRITQGTNSDDEKSRAIRAIYKLLESVLGKLASASYIVADAVPATDWGYDGETQEARKMSIKRLPNQAIDTGHYQQKARLLRSTTSFSIFRRLFQGAADGARAALSAFN